MIVERYWLPRLIRIELMLTPKDHSALTPWNISTFKSLNFQNSLSHEPQNLRNPDQQFIDRVWEVLTKRSPDATPVAWKIAPFFFCTCQDHLLENINNSVTEFGIVAIPRFMNLSSKAYLGRLVVSVALMFSFGVAWIIAQWFESRDSFVLYGNYLSQISLKSPYTIERLSY